MAYSSKNHYTQRQKGISLFVVLVILLLSTLFGLWASRSSLFNELVISNDADYQRAFEAAQALIQDAELDINGKKPDGSACSLGNVYSCRPANGTNPVWYPEQDQELGDVISALSGVTTGCLKGICIKRAGNQDFWTDTATLAAMTSTAAGVNAPGARYGQFTGAQVGALNSKASSPILNNRTANNGGWYWVEILPYDPSASNSGLITNGSANLLGLNLVPMIAYRITAVARGLKQNTQVVLQSTYVQQKLKD